MTSTKKRGVKVKFLDCFDEGCRLDHCACGTHDWENEAHECDPSFLRREADPNPPDCFDERCRLDHCACGTHDWENEVHACDPNFLRGGRRSLRAVERETASPWLVRRRLPPRIVEYGPAAPKFGVVGAGRLRLRRRSS